MSLATQTVLVEAYIAALAQVRAQLTRLLIDLFTAPKSWRDPDRDRFVERAVPIVLGAQSAAASLTDDYLSRMIADQTGEPYRARGVDLNRVTGAAVRNGVAPSVVYRRPHQEVWTSLGEDKRRTEAYEKAVEPVREPGEDIFAVLDRIDAEKAARKQQGRGEPDLPERETLPERRTRIELPDLPRPATKPLTEAVGRGERRAKLLGLTDLELAVTHTARERLADDNRIRYFRRVLTGAENCGLCVVASTQRYHKADLLPIHPACVVDGTRVSADGVKAITRRRYTGELAVIATASGDELTVTPNHPVLTEQGWVPAHHVREGMHVLRSLGADGVHLGGPDEGHRPSLIEDVWRAASVFPVVRVPVAAEDFHGDGFDGEVDVVDVDGSLHAVHGADRVKVPGEHQLMSGHGSWNALAGLSSKTTLLPTGSAPAGRRVRGSGLLGPLLGSHLGGPHHSGIGVAAALNVAVLEYRADGGPLDAVLGSQAIFRRAAEVLLNDFLGGQVAPRPAPRRYDPAGAEFRGEGLLVYASQGRSLLDRLAGQVEPDRVVDVRRVDSATCHVYNLHTDEGWYAAGGMIVSNCDCVIAPILGDIDPGHVINSKRVSDGVTPTGESRSGVPVFSDDQLIDLGELLEPVHDAIRETFGRSARDARQLDYRKVLTVHQHGELGPVLSVKGHRFTRRQIRDDDLATGR